MGIPHGKYRLFYYGVLWYAIRIVVAISLRRSDKYGV
jgi:hypothetical protein